MITSTGSAQVKHVIQLQKKAKVRKEFHAFVVEGIKMVAEAPKERIVKAYFSETFERINPAVTEGLALDGNQMEIVSDSVFDHMCDTKTPQGVLAVIRMCDYSLRDLMKGNAFVIGIENLQDPGNLGTIIRMGEGAGVTGGLISPNTVDIYNPKTIRSTMGSIYRVPFYYADDFCGDVRRMQQSGVKVYAAHLNGESEYTQPDYTGPSAFLIGNEGNGLTAAATAAADTLIRIPMEGQVESLNAAVACTILTYEARRQRLMSDGIPQSR